MTQHSPNAFETSKNKTKQNKTRSKYKETSVFKWYIVRTFPSYSNITKRCFLCLHENLKIFHYPNTEELLNKRHELIAKCRHAKKYLLSNYKSNNPKLHKESLPATQRDALEDWLPWSSCEMSRKLPHCEECQLFHPVPWWENFPWTRFPHGVNYPQGSLCVVPG